MRVRSLRLLLLTFVLGVPLASGGARAQKATYGPDDPPGTFSILGFDPQTGEIGAAVQSCVFSVGNGVLWAEAEVGAVATQATVDVSYGPQGLALLKKGMAPQDIIKKILDDDPDKGLNGRPWPKTGRQFAVMNAKGEFAAHTGSTSQAWAGHKAGKFCTAQGNILAGPDVVGNMIDAFEKTEFAEDGRRRHISLRLVAALEGAQAAGGDKRCQRSAALVVVGKNRGVWLNNDVVLRLQVDDSPEPIKEMRRLVEMSPAGRGRGRGGIVD
jgi:uncharacterized Ntn-hydrolase superfamily protein